MLKTCLTILASMMVTLSFAARADVAELDNDELQKLIAEGVTVIDVRREDEWRSTGVIEGSHLLTFFDAKGRYDAGAWLKELNKISRAEDPVVLICAHGVRSSNISQLLDRKVGFSQVHNVNKGIISWIKADLPVVPYKPQ